MSICSYCDSWRSNREVKYYENVKLHDIEFIKNKPKNAFFIILSFFTLQNFFYFLYFEMLNLEFLKPSWGIYCDEIKLCLLKTQ